MMPGLGRRARVLVDWNMLVLFALALTVPAVAHARHGGDDGDVRVTGTCARGASSKLRLRSDGGDIRVEFEVRRRRSGERWRVVLVHERRVACRGTARTRGSSGFRVRRTGRRLRRRRSGDRASGPRGMTCAASATLRD